MKVDALTSSESNEWYTPARYTEIVRRFLGGIDLDPCSSASANRTVKADRIFTIEDNALVQPWHARSVYMNPPYGTVGGKSQAGIFCHYMMHEYFYKHFPDGVILVNSCTGSRWFQPLFDHSVCFVDHRIKYEVPPLPDDATPMDVLLAILNRASEKSRAKLIAKLEGKTKEELLKVYHSVQPTKDNAFIYLGKRVGEFQEQFKELGRIRIASTLLKGWVNGR